MDENKRPVFSGGRNMAMKVPPHQWEETVAFYRDVLGLPVLAEYAPDLVFAFGKNRLWIDRADGLSQAEIWLEVRTEDVPASARYLAGRGVPRRDEIEPLPEGFDGFWITSPAGIIHLVASEE